MSKKKRIKKEKESIREGMEKQEKDSRTQKFEKQGRILGIGYVSQASERRRYGPTDGRTDRPSYRDARTHLKNKRETNNQKNKAKGAKNQEMKERKKVGDCFLEVQ